MLLIPYRAPGRLPTGQQPRIAMPRKGSGVRDRDRVLRVRAATVLAVRTQNGPALTQGNARRLPTRAPPHVDVRLRQVEHAEREAMGSCVGSTRQQRWGWHASAPHPGPRGA